MDKPLKTGDAVRVNRPGRKGHGWVGCYVSTEPDTPFGWVAFQKKEAERTQPPPSSQLHKQDAYPRVLYPLSQLEKHESHS